MTTEPTPITEPTPMTSERSLPLVLHVEDLATLLRRSRRSIDRLRRAKALPDPIFGDGRRPCWSRDAILAWLNGAPLTRGRRR